MIEEISPISEVTKPESAATSAALGRDDFLRMLVAQLENQDPLNPQDSTEFTAQLAQFSSLEQLLSISAGLQDLAAAQQAFTRSFQGLSSAGLIGREVLASGNRFEVGKGSSSQLAFELEGTAEQVRIRFLDEGGRTVKSLDLELERPLSAGLHVIPEADFAELDLSPGVYGFEVEASNDEVAVTTETRVLGRVTGVVPSGASAGFELGGVSVPFEQLVRVRDAEVRP